MTPLIDLTNNRYGRLIVLRRGDNDGKHTMWICQCDCGKIKSVRGSSLKDFYTLSCGCLQLEKVREFSDLTGRIFGRLTVIKRMENKKGELTWLCQCSCGNTSVVRAGHLKDGETISCGCFRRESSSQKSIINIIGNRYSMLRVVERLENKNEKPYYMCICDCGRTTSASGANLKRGFVQSCGCLKESFISSELKKYYEKEMNAKSEYKILRNPKTGKFLPYDIYFEINEKNFFIEVNGIQHYKIQKYFYGDNSEFEYRKSKDRIKRKYARKNGIYIEIDLRKKNTVGQWIEYINSFI